MPPEISHIGQHQIIRFDHIITNIGNAYSHQTGIFRAPVSGVYVFSTETMAHGHMINFELMQNGHIVDGTVATGSLISTSSMWPLAVNKGDELWVRSLKIGNSLGVVHGYCNSAFAGFLLHANE